MNWRLSALDRLTLISNSDAHSPAKLGREANIFDTGISYPAIIDAIRTKKGFAGTIEFFPEEGKYHYDGHRACAVSFTPEETMRHSGLCPVCGKNLTIGVMHRVEKLADRKEGLRPEGALPFTSIIPLPEIIAEVVKTGVNSKKVTGTYVTLLGALGNEFRILLETPLQDIEAAGSPLLRDAVKKMRDGDVDIVPGYDGEFGKIRILETAPKKEPKGQPLLL
jgi:PHP family Zn ribbon phosphoesterase